MKAKKKRKAKTWTWRGWGLRLKDGFVATYCKEVAEENASDWRNGVTLVRVVAKVTEVKR